MKKTTILLMLVLIVLSFGLFGCSKDYEYTLSLEKKYIENEYIYKPEDQQVYYIFYKDGTGKFHRPEYTVTFRYFTIKEDGMVAMFYDSSEFNPGYSEEDLRWVTSTWCNMYGYTKDYLAGANVYYICEGFLPQIPNFGK